MRYQQTSYHLTIEDAEKAKAAFLAYEEMRRSDPEARITPNIPLATSDGMRVTGFKLDGFHWGTE